MNKTHTGLKRYLTAAVVFLLGILLAVSLIRIPAIAARAEENSGFTEPNPVSLSISNTQFADHSGTAPSSPTGWTGGGMTGVGGDGVIAGVISLDPSDYTKVTKDEDVYKLSDYPEYKKDIPRTPFGLSSTYEGTNSNVLMINTDKTKTAYAYTSESITFAAGGYYRLSVFVKTGNFAEGQGAHIKLTGLPEELSFKNINTVKNLKTDAEGNPDLSSDKLLGFKQYTFYVAAPLVGDSTVELSLQVGDRVEDGAYSPAQGYAFFDNIVAEQISANTYYHETESYADSQRDNYIVKDFNKDINYLTDSGDVFYLYDEDATAAGTEIGTFDNEFTGWTRINDLDGIKGGSAFIHPTNESFDADNTYGWTSKPLSPVGNRADNDKVLVLHSKEQAAFGYRSPEFTVHRNTFYRITYWVNTVNVLGGSGACAVIRGTSGISDNDNELKVVSSSLSGDSANVMRYGWKMQSFYIKGSALKDYTASLELWLGQPDGEATGTAMFDEIRVEKLTPSQYSSNSSSGTIVVFDSVAEDTGMTNGTFTEVGDYEKYQYPLLPASWTLIKPDTAETTGFAKDKVDSADEVVSGIVSTDIEHYDANRHLYNNVANPMTDGSNLLLISSLKDTAIAYRSPTVTVATGKSYRLTTTINTSNISGYGVNLALKSGNDVIATVEGIGNTNGAFRTYTFYIEGGLADKTVSLEIWLGMNDRVNNRSKLASGNIFVKNVSFAELAEGESFETYAKEYDSLRSSGAPISAAAYSFDKFGMSAYDYYGNGAVKTPYNWQLYAGDASEVIYGIFDNTALTDRTEIPEYFENEGATNNGVLYLHNRIETYSEIRTKNALSLAENSYYRVNVSLKVDLPETMRNDENARGASIKLLDTDFKFSNIKSTATTVDEITDNETFKTFTFYIKTGSATEITLGISLGESIYPNRACRGRVYVNSIEMTSINNVVYEEAVKDLDDDEEYIINADLSATSDEQPEEPTEPKEIEWWLIPSILFAAALVIAIVGVFVRKLLDKRAEKKEIKVTNSYDRKTTLNKIHNRKSEGGDTVEADVADDSYEEFDDTLSPAPAKAKDEQAASAGEATDEYDEFDDDKPEEKVEEKAEVEQGADNAESEAQTEESAATEGEAAETEESETAEKVEEKTETEKAEPKKAEAKKPEVKKVERAKPTTSGDAYVDEFED